MKIFSHLITLVILIFSTTAFAISQAEVIERCSHDIMKLARNKQLPEEVATKMHLAKIKKTEVGFQVLVILDHNQDHNQPAAHAIFDYDTTAKLTNFQFKQGYINPSPTAFNIKSTAKLFDIAAELLYETNTKELLSYAENLAAMHLEYDNEKNIAIFEMIDSNKKEFQARFNLNGELIDYTFLN